MRRARGGGRKPKPTALKLVSGNPGRRPIAADEPTVEALLELPAPDWMSGLALVKWADITAKLADAGMLARDYEDLITVYCVAYARWRNAQDKLLEFGELVRAPKTGMAKDSPYLRIADKAQQQMMVAMSEMGLTPSSRTRTRTVGKGKQTKLEQFLSGKIKRRA